MTRVTYFAGVSLDGRIAGPDDDLAFLATMEGTFPEGQYNMWNLIRSFDSMIMGAVTFRVMLREITGGSYPAWPYGDTPVWVMTHRSLPDVPGASLRHAAGSPRALVSTIEATGAERTWLVGGANVAAQFLEQDLIDEIILGVAPAVVGFRARPDRRSLSAAHFSAARLSSQRFGGRPQVRAGPDCIVTPFSRFSRRKRTLEDPDLGTLTWDGGGAWDGRLPFPATGSTVAVWLRASDPKSAAEMEAPTVLDAIDVAEPAELTLYYGFSPGAGWDDARFSVGLSGWRPQDLALG